MTGQEQARAYRETLIAICYLVTVAAVLNALGHSVEALGVAGVVTGLIGVIRMPNSRQVEVTNSPDSPIPVEPAS